MEKWGSIRNECSIDCKRLSKLKNPFYWIDSMATIRLGKNSIYFHVECRVRQLSAVFWPLQNIETWKVNFILGIPLNRSRKLIIILWTFIINSVNNQFKDLFTCHHFFEEVSLESRQCAMKNWLLFQNGNSQATLKVYGKT